MSLLTELKNEIAIALLVEKKLGAGVSGNDAKGFLDRIHSELKDIEKKTEVREGDKEDKTSNPIH